MPSTRPLAVVTGSSSGNRQTAKLTIVDLASGEYTGGPCRLSNLDRKRTAGVFTGG